MEGLSRSLKYFALQVFRALLEDSCYRDESVYLGVSINAEPGQGQVAVLGVRESSRHLG